ncbi:hypothetical protein IMSHALPRED_003408 [Imshaugia aleurites]|uniref:Uncharacterized protein n=1 Tax=Imshaugia aleurites TaxID=172621 RepID=A0A8H3PK04_9LECA|nr:hypothetical protein IMSHALPRED_003408 [Imshaugia aleurites]
MATTFYAKITDAIANDETQLKEYVQAKVHESCPVNDNWLNVSIRYGTPGAEWALTPRYISISVLDKIWKYFNVTKFEPDIYPRVVLFKPPTWKKTFSSVRVIDKRGVVLWDLHDTKKVPTEDIYAGLVPAGCAVDFVQVDMKYLAPIRVDKPTAGPSEANERSEESEASISTQPGIVDAERRLEQLKLPFVPTDIESNDGDVDS